MMPSYVLSNETFQIQSWQRHSRACWLQDNAGWYGLGQDHHCFYCHEHHKHSDTHPVPNHLAIRRSSVCWGRATIDVGRQFDLCGWTQPQTRQEKLPEGIYTCKITNIGGYNNGGMGASENLLLWVFTGSFTHIKGGQAGAVNDTDDAPDIVEDVAQWWHKNEITSVAGAERSLCGRW